MNNFRYFILFTFYFNLITAKIQAMQRKGLKFRKVLKESRFPRTRNSLVLKMTLSCYCLLKISYVILIILNYEKIKALTIRRI